MASQNDACELARLEALTPGGSEYLGDPPARACAPSSAA